MSDYIWHSVNTRGNLLTPYFCGHEPECTTDSEYSFKKSLQNLKYFDFIGILENYKESLKILEAKFPEFFTGLTKKYDDRRPHHLNSNDFQFVKKRNLTEMELLLLRKRYAYDIKFYEIVKRKFYIQRKKYLNF